MSVSAPSIAHTSAGAAASHAVMQLFLLLIFVTAYLNPILRADQDSIYTGFRLLLPVAVLLVGIRFVRYPRTRQFAFYVLIASAYYLIQLLVRGLLTDPFVLSYLINTIALIFFVYFVRIYVDVYGARSFYRHLDVWYLVLIVTSVHQLLTGFNYPVVPPLGDQQVARIFFGQENDTSLAIAAFLPMLVDRARRSPVAALLLISGLVVIYMNSTRGVLVAVAMYPLVLGGISLASRAGRRLKALSIVIAVMALTAIAAGAYFLRDIPIAIIGDDNASLAELVLDPLTEIASGEKQDAELTSINLRVTTIVVGLQEYAASWGFGVGPGASTHFVRAYYPDVAGSMHVFALQLLTESGWLLVLCMIAIARTWGPRLGWGRFLPRLFYYTAITLSMTGGAITNYYYFSCAILALTSASALDPRLLAGRGRSLRSIREPR